MSLEFFVLTFEMGVSLLPYELPFHQSVLPFLNIVRAGIKSFSDFRNASRTLAYLVWFTALANNKLRVQRMIQRLACTIQHEFC